MRKIASIFLSLVMVLLGVFFVSCKPDSNEPVAEVETLSKNYVYMWNGSGVGGAKKLLRFQTERYAIESDGDTGSITKLGGYVSTEEQVYSKADFDKLITISKTDYSAVINGQEYLFNRHDGYHRVIESGRYVSRADYNALVSDNDLNNRFTGRFEIAATQNYFTAVYQIHNSSSDNLQGDLSFTFKFDQDFSVSSLGERGLTLRSASGQGFTILKTKDDLGTQIRYDSNANTLTVLKQNVSFNSGTFSGFAVHLIPSIDATTTDASILENIENSTVLAFDRENSNSLPVEFNNQKGVWEVDLSSVNPIATSQKTENSRDSYDRVGFSVKNNSSDKSSVPITFKKTSNISITGVSPVIRDFNTLEPVGIQVQISKNWHTNGSNEVPKNAPSRLFEGQWYCGSTLIDVEPNQTSAYEYTCAYGQWGGVPAVSHAQLCLVGWGGANNLLWDQSAMGSWGESVTYDPDMGLGRAIINDVRPFLIKSPQGNNEQYNWTGNVGGANFLDYYPSVKQVKVVDQTVTYNTQAPNLTDVVYSGVTSDGAIKSKITVNMGRTDDVVRTYYTVKYTFLKDVSFERVSLFKLCADTYSDNSYRKYAIGNGTGVLQAGTINDVSVGYMDSSAKESPTNDLWFGLYESSEPIENGDVSYVVREYKANVNNKLYTKPSYRMYGTDNGGKLQPSCELSLPNGVKNVSAGSTVEFVVEFLVLPALSQAYYGNSDYLLANNYFGTVDQFFDQVDGGKITVAPTKGELISTYPVTLKSAGGEVPVQFNLTGGLGYVPVRIKGLDGYSGWKLQVKKSSGWTDVVQSGSIGSNSNDFWQTYYDSSTGKYELTFNVKNTTGTDYQKSEEYRLVKK